jgi:hypothetical protein
MVQIAGPRSKVLRFDPRGFVRDDVFSEGQTDEVYTHGYRFDEKNLVIKSLN